MGLIIIVNLNESNLLALVAANVQLNNQFRPTKKHSNSHVSRVRNCFVEHNK